MGIYICKYSAVCTSIGANVQIRKMWQTERCLSTTKGNREQQSKSRTAEHLYTGKQIGEEGKNRLPLREVAKRRKRWKGFQNRFIEPEHNRHYGIDTQKSWKKEWFHLLYHTQFSLFMPFL